MANSPVVVCPACGREDFAGGKRCQFCTELLAGPPASGEGDLAFALDDLGVESPAGPAAPPAPPAPQQAEPPKRLAEASRQKGLKGWAAAVALFLWKAKALLLFGAAKAKYLFLLLKSGKFLTTGISMLGTMWLYALVDGWVFAAGIVVLLFVHEMGHVWAMRRKGIPISAPVFIPFLGALIAMKKHPQDAETEAAVGIGGPALGSLAALVCLGAYGMTGWEPLIPIAYFGFLVNLFNLVPVPPMDGGRIAAAISPRIWWIGVPILVLIGIRTGSFVIWLVLLFGIPRILAARAGAEYYQVSGSARRAYGLAYLGLLAVVSTLMFVTHEMGAATGRYRPADFRVNGQAGAAPNRSTPTPPTTGDKDLDELLRSRPKHRKPEVSSEERARRIREMPLSQKGIWMISFCVAMFLAWLVSAALASAGAGRRPGLPDVRDAATAMLAGALLLATHLAGIRLVPHLVSAYLVVGVGVFVSSAIGALGRLYSGRHGDRGGILYRGVVFGFLGLLVFGLAAPELRSYLLFPLLAATYLLARNPSFPLSAYAEARYGRRPGDAARFLERALRWPLLSRRGRMALHNELSSACLRQGDYERGSTYARLAVEDADAWPSLEVMPRGNLAGACVELGRYQEAAEQCERIFYLVRKGRCFGGAGEWVPHAHRALAHLNARRGVFDEALLHADKVLAAMPPDRPPAGNLRTSAVIAHWCRAQALGAQGEPAPAEKECSAALRLGPRPIWLSHVLSAHAGIRCGAGRWADAEADARRALELFPDSPDAHYWLAQALIGQGRRDEAEGHLAAGAARYPESAYGERCHSAAQTSL